MRRAAALLALCLAAALPAQSSRAQDAAAQAGAAAAELQAAVAALEAARGARDRVAALTVTIRAYERGLAAMREGLRQAAIREAALELTFQARRARLSQILGVLAAMKPDAGPLLLLHPSGPLGSARSGMILADVTPALQAEAEGLRRQLVELRDLRALQDGAAGTLSAGLRAAQVARTDLSQAISERAPLPAPFTEAPDALRGLLESADTLDAFAAGLGVAPETAEDGAIRDFAAARGLLPLPVLGRVLLRANEADAAGVRRPGIVLGARAHALVTAPWPATIRYLGPLLDYGNVMILEPGAGYLLVLAGLETAYGAPGEVVAAGAPLGLMGGVVPDVTEFLAAAEEGGSARDTETLYIEVRQGAVPVDPAEWFAGIGE